MQSVVADSPDSQAFGQIQNGRYLAIAADCAACHTVPDTGKPFAGGRAIETPFGNIVAPNITPDRDTGIGAWTDDEFDDAVRRGIRPNGARLYPAMPYTAYTKMSRADVLAIRAYLKTVAAGAKSGGREHAALPVQHPRRDAGLGCALFHGGRIHARSATVGRMEPGRLPGARARALRCLPHAEVVPGRRQDQRISARREPAGLVRARHHQRCQDRPRPLVRG